MTTTETHLIHTLPNSSYVRVPVSAEVPAGYVALGLVPAAKHPDYLYRMEQAGYPALWRRNDGMVVDRSLITAREADDIYWSKRRDTDIYVWAPTHG